MISQMEAMAGMFAVVAMSLSGCATLSSTASGFPLNGVDGVSAEGTRTVTKTIAWNNQDTKFVHTASIEVKFWTTDYSCFLQPSDSCSFSSRTEEKQSDIQSTVLQSLENGALTVTRHTVASDKSECKPFQQEALAQTLPVRNGTADCPGSEKATCDVWRQYTLYKPKSNTNQSWSKYNTEVLYYFNGGEPVAQVETKTMSSSGKTTTIVATMSFSKWEEAEVEDSKFSPDKDWSCKDKTALTAGAVSV